MLSPAFARVGLVEGCEEVVPLWGRCEACVAGMEGYDVFDARFEAEAI